MHKADVNVYSQRERKEEGTELHTLMFSPKLMNNVSCISSSRRCEVRETQEGYTNGFLYKEEGVGKKHSPLSTPF